MSTPVSWPKPLSFLVMGTAATALNLQTVLSHSRTAGTLFSHELWSSSIKRFGGRVTPLREGGFEAKPEFLKLFLMLSLVTLITWLLGSFLLHKKTDRTFAQAAHTWGTNGWRWWLLPAAWELLMLIGFLINWDSLTVLLTSTPMFWYSVLLAGWVASFVQLCCSPKPLTAASEKPRRVPLLVLVGIGVYSLVFIAMNWQLYHGLWIPHGDSAMYEEHLWNLTHGKGFRSYLDQGLFLGEHIQVIHLGLLPLYVLWPSHLLMELCETLALASGAIPVCWIALRHTNSQRIARGLAIAYLLYFPLQFLDIAIDLKTFRPISFGVPLLLFSLDQMERGRWKTMTLLMVLTMLAKEDFALVLAPLGVWLAVTSFLANERKTPMWVGIGMCLLSVGYLFLSTRVLIPYFRQGEEVHYARYFSAFGESLGEIGWTMLTRPDLLFEHLVTAQSVLYVLSVLVPIAFLPLFSPSRFAVAAPLLVLLCLNEIAQDPRHHFHAPLVPFVFWAAAAGLGNLARWQSSQEKGTPSENRSLWWCRFAVSSALMTGVFFSLSPVGLAFWDSGSRWHWANLYKPGPRAEHFPAVYEQVPKSARVASTDFVHTRFTHHERSYDYSNYARKVSGYELRVPDDTEYIVIDTQHPYSEIRSPEQVKEYTEHPERWEFLPDVSDGYFLVFRRRE